MADVVIVSIGENFESSLNNILSARAGVLNHCRIISDVHKRILIRWELLKQLALV